MSLTIDRKAVFIDLPNFYSQLIRFLREEDILLLKGYFLTWLDFDILAKEITNSSSDIWIFYSEKRIGPSNARIEGKELQNYIKRINMLEGVTAYDVNIPGEQREYFTINCPNCKRESQGESASEKGIDASLAVHMFDTMDSWNVAFLLSGDADFVPAVKSLRRRGKMVIGGGFPSIASSAILRECYSYIDLFDKFIRFDMAMYLLFKTDGIIYNWLAEEKVHLPENNKYRYVSFSFYLSSSYLINFTWSGVNKSSFLENQLNILNEKYHYLALMSTVADNETFIIPSCSVVSVKRRIASLCQQIETIKNLKIEKKSNDGLEFSYRIDFS
jgi:uncharacterized LabA/DUF88 family protein